MLRSFFSAQEPVYVCFLFLLLQQKPAGTSKNTCTMCATYIFFFSLSQKQKFFNSSEAEYLFVLRFSLSYQGHPRKTEEKGRKENGKMEEERYYSDISSKSTFFLPELNHSSFFSLNKKYLACLYYNRFDIIFHGNASAACYRHHHYRHRHHHHHW